ncbi:MAG: hypothetical protein HGGPFJEG_00255 [Ignavibacteria bacterium]|nr:hypothetical protein [Ignavibacteria bacterium]
MALGKGKTIIKEIDGIRCVVVESGIDELRLNFLKKILEYNGYEVKTETIPSKSDDQPPAYTLYVTDIIFNPVISVYGRRLRTPENKILTPQYWNGKPEESDKWYWDAES